MNTKDRSQKVETRGPLQWQRQTGDSMFALIVFIFELFLLSQIGNQTKWIDGLKLIAQPRFWPGLSLAFMLLFSGGYLFLSVRDITQKKSNTRDAQIWQPKELLNWMRTLEYATYFLVYVIVVPILGYLPSTLIFSLLLTLRAGYRNKKFVFWSIASGILIVIVFKTFLQVKLPAGQVYDDFPEIVAGIMIRYF